MKWGPIRGVLAGRRRIFPCVADRIENRIHLHTHRAAILVPVQSPLKQRNRHRMLLPLGRQLPVLVEAALVFSGAAALGVGFPVHVLVVFLMNIWWLYSLRSQI